MFRVKAQLRGEQLESMELDETDQKILYLLKKETRTSLTHAEIADRIGVSSSTVSNRIQALKADGIVESINPQINYENAGVPYHMLFVCTVPIEQRKALAKEVIEVDGVVETRELLTGRRNLHVEVVSEEINTVELASEAIESLGISIEESDIFRRKNSQPLNYFIQDELDESER
ncbi:Lrp/AsnC family transcriptional regulator [Halobacteria archaeon AArc-curdl1]|uniref:Lrp/AsnC family transcriptional regulator n=1 Tax=Natronosalvus hydrolyticus TaxID=2979988 RepID=A0AAP3E6N2_9EURY|nr:Lrp/AsnC family transcriptional regulator [Halobacteria archaeon AArc-curdl1]